MLSNGYSEYEYDSANRLIKADGHEYTYNAEDVRIRNLCSDADTTYTYNTNCRLSQLLCKTTNGITTKYVYGHGLIGEEKCGKFKTYHFDYRGSTVAITNINGDITDTFKYDTYGKLISRTGSSFVIFGYNGRDGVITDKNGLYYMRARYYSPEMRRFINADILHGEISDSTSLNRYAYVNGNPVSYVDPFGLSAEERGNNSENDEFYGNCTKAILVTKFSLPVVGHSELYFLDGKGVWWRAEFNLYGYSEIVDNLKNKHKAEVSFEKKTPPPYDIGFSGSFNYTELTGNFNESVKLAEFYVQNTDRLFNGYNLLVNNCADYTDLLLDVADVDGMFSQIMIGEDDFISVPLIREFKMSVACELDSTINWSGNNIKKAGTMIQNSSFYGSEFLGNMVIGCGDLFIDGTNYVGDVVCSMEGFINDGLGPIKDFGARGVKKIWDWINPW